MLGNLRHLPRLAQWWFHPHGRRQALALLGPLRRRYAGCRCVVIGNGPSLKQMDLRRLDDEFTFGLNRIYLMKDELAFDTTFYVAINRFVLSQFGGEIGRLQGLKFLNWSYRDERFTDTSTVYLETKPILRPDGRLLSGYYAGGGTVTLLALQLAYFMGFSEVLLIGVDHSYSQTGTPNKAVRAGDVDQDHFSGSYFAAGVTWQLPDLRAMERGYRHIKALYEGDGRHVVDCTLGGKLEVFAKAELARMLDDSRWLNRREFEAESDAHRHS
jgi:hypothetical protein